jgi:hypothetical protein
MKNIKKILNTRIILLVAMLSVLGACTNEDFLNRSPLDSPSPENFFIDAVSARSAVNASYRPWTSSPHTYGRDLTITLDAMTDDSYWRPARRLSIAAERWDFTPTNNIIGAYWTQAYRSINAANFAIERIPTSSNENFTPEEQAPFIAEARFVRAWSYLFLTSLFGNVPLHTETSIVSKPRSSRADVLAQVVEDLEYASNNLLTSPPEAGVPAAAAATGFLAKAYLWLNDLEKAEVAARKAISQAEGAGFGLVDDYLSIWDIEENRELLFALQFKSNDPQYGQNATVQRLVRDIPTALRAVEPGNGWGYCLPQRDLYDAFEDGDPRRGYTMYAHGDDYGMYPASDDFVYSYDTYNALGDVISETVTYQTGDMVTYNHNWSPSGLNVKKMTRKVSDLGNARWSGMDIPILRMSELYLILAEALAEQGSVEALTWVNLVRQRASVNMPDKTTADGDLIDLVRHERRVELAMEGVRLFDLVRWGTLSEVFGDGTKVKRHFFSDFIPGSNIVKYDAPVGDLTLFSLLPTPQIEIDQNPEINEQVPGY